MNEKQPLALIAEDEPLLAAALAAELQRAWPGLRLLPAAGDGACAVEQALEHRPELLFFDIRMPGLGGLEAAAELADAWPAGGPPFPALVFVTAYDQYAIQAFEAQAVDYLLKPVQPARLQKTVERLRDALARRAAQPAADPAASAAAPVEAALAGTVDQLRRLLAATAPSPAAVQAPSLRMLQVSVGSAIRMVPVQEVVYLEAADKYVRLLTREHEYLMRTPLKDLLPQLDPADFWQIHRGTVVRADAVDSVLRDASGKLSLRLRGREEKLPVSRLYAHQFKAM